jgi:hypothetical protein
LRWLVLAVALALGAGGCESGVSDPPAKGAPPKRPTKGGPNQLVPCPQCRMPIWWEKLADGSRVAHNPDGSLHDHTSGKP